MPESTPTERIAHAAASPEGANSTYVLPDRGVVIDPGPPGEASWRTLTEGLPAAGLSVDAVEVVIVTHWHADHAGVAPRLAAAAGVPVTAHASDAPLIGDYAIERERRLDRDASRLREWGVPDRIVAAIGDADEPSPMPDRCAVDAVEDGDSVAGVEAVHTPGHTEGHLAIDAGDALFLGDSVLPTYTPNVGGSDTRSTRPLSAYLHTLDRLEERLDRPAGSEDRLGESLDGPEGVRAFPGHGPTVDLPARIETIRAHHAERVREVVCALPGPGDADGEASSSTARGRTPWEVARDLFGEMRGIHAKMGAGEAAAHLAFAAEREFVERVGSDPDRYRRTGADASPDRVASALSASRYC
ncbi:MBL fold metallo-hydrolase [Halobellus sp. GM3]|uniref:MBL fold metallo-hydrolase n=1 Tax=Halobellus sp. GM3 TaxID=3458410 RepID=UPI00403DFC19